MVIPFRAVRITCVWALALVVLSVVPARNTALRITIVAGDGEKYAEGARANKPLVIQVTDGLGHPVEGARVSFQLPEEGPGGTFLNGLRTDLAIADAGGRMSAGSRSTASRDSSRFALQPPKSRRARASWSANG